MLNPARAHAWVADGINWLALVKLIMTISYLQEQKRINTQTTEKN